MKVNNQQILNILRHVVLDDDVPLQVETNVNGRTFNYLRVVRGKHVLRIESFLAVSVERDGFPWAFSLCRASEDEKSTLAQLLGALIGKMPPGVWQDYVAGMLDACRGGRYDEDIQPETLGSSLKAVQYSLHGDCGQQTFGIQFYKDRRRFELIVTCDDTPLPLILIEGAAVRETYAAFTKVRTDRVERMAEELRVFEQFLADEQQQINAVMMKVSK